MKKKFTTKTLVQLSLLAAIEIVMAFTPLGFIPLPFIKATTVHIPVIIGAILLGPLAGGILGGVMGITSVINNTINPAITSFVFTPFLPLGPANGNFWSLVVAIVPRILIGVLAAYAYRALAKTRAKSFLAYIIAGIVGSMTNTFFVMSGIYIFFGQRYAEARNVPFETLMNVILGVVFTNGVFEAIIAGILTVAIAKPLHATIFRQRFESA